MTTEILAQLADPLREANEPSSHVARFGPERPLRMDCGVVLEHWQIAYQTYGTPNAARLPRNSRSSSPRRR